MHLNIVKSKNAQQFYILEGYRNANGKCTTRIVKKLGTYEQLAKEHDDPVAWAKSVVDEMNSQAKEGKQQIMVPLSPSTLIEKGQQCLFNGGYLFLQKLFYQMRLDYICRQISKKYDFAFDLKDILSDLIYGRILAPGSKLATYDYAQTMLEAPSYELQDVYRALEVIGQEKDFIQSSLYKFSKSMGKRNDKILYYDCTNYYFEIEQESGMRKYGPSKEHRPNPIVEMGLFMDGDGIPLAFCLHNGNTNEQKTLKPLEQQIMQDFGHSKFIVCTDSGLSSIANRKFNNTGERAFITTQSIKKMKAFQREWALSSTGWHLPGHTETFDLDQVLADECLCKKYAQWIFYKETWFHENGIEQKYIVTFSIKYRNYQRNIRNEQIARAERALSSANKQERVRQSDYKRFITRIPVTDSGEVAHASQYVLNEDKIREEEQYDGFYAIATNLDDTPESIIRINRGRWEIEECFRVMKHEFKARPVYLSREARITAHFTICFLALTLFRYLEKILGHQYTCEQISDGLRKIKFQRIENAGYIPAYTRNDFTDAIHDAFGFRTDYQILSKAQMRKIISMSKVR